MWGTRQGTWRLAGGTARVGTGAEDGDDMDLTVWLLGAGLTVRLTLLLTRDRVTAGLRDRVDVWSAVHTDGWRGRLAWWAGGVVGCPWCASPYVGAVVLACSGLPGWWAVATVGCWSLVAGVVGESLGLLDSRRG